MAGLARGDRVTLLAASGRRRFSGPQMVARWAFEEPSAPYYTTDGDLPLTDTGAPTSAGIAFGARSVALGEGSSLYIPAEQTGRLHVGGLGPGTVTVACWVRATVNTDQFFVAGIWQEDGLGPKRQYGIFGSLPGLRMSSRSCFHVSRLGGPSPGWIYSYDASGNPSPAGVTNVWQFYAGTYDGTYARSYMNGVFTEDPSVFTPYATSQRNPYYYPDGLNPTSGAFTVGAITGPNPLTDSRSYLKGRLADLRVWDVALDASDISAMFEAERATYGV